MRGLAPLCLAVSLLAACDGALPGSDGPLKLGIVSGNRQVAVAGDKQLGEPVVGKLVRTPGGIAFHIVTPAYAQGTTVNGSPVAGAVVCAVAVSDAALQAFVPCTNTGSDGTATFFFSPGTKAGEAKSEIRGTVEGKPAVFDTVVATVKPGPAVRHIFEGKGFGSRPSPATFPLLVGLPAEPLVSDAHNNPLEYSLRPRSLARQAGPTGEASRTIIAEASGCTTVDAVVADTVVWTGVMRVGYSTDGSAISLSFPQASQLTDPRWSDRDCYYGRK